MIALALLLATQSPTADVEAPIIEDVAAAASNPDAPPVITVLMSDRGTGVGNAFVHFRAPGGPWQKADLKGGTSGLFIARLPDGAQHTGFEYWIEATDIAGNGPARIASPERPIVVEKAVEPTLQRIERQREEQDDAAPVRIHPAWLMASLGVGVLAGAGASAFALDIKNVQQSIDEEQATGARLAELEQARTQDAVAASTLGVVAAAGLATGVVLAVLSSLE